MTVARRYRVLIIMMLVAGEACARAAEAGQDPRVEVWGAGTVVSGFSGQVSSSYSPPLLLDGDFSSSGTQMLTLDGGHGPGLTGGVNVFLAPHAGIQVLLDRVWTTWSGGNGPYDVTLHYISHLPPDNEAVLVDVQQSTPWPNSTGSLTQTAVGLNGVVRLGRAAGVSATVSGGLTVHRFGGTVQPLAYTSFRLGGHSVLFQDDYRLSASFEPSTTVGWNGGGEVSIAMGPRVAFLVGYRYLGSAGQDTSLRPTAILNSDQVVSPQTIGEIANQLGPLHARLSLSGSRFLVGVKFRR